MFLNRSLLVFLFDLLAAGMAWVGAFWLRFNFAFSPDHLPTMWSGLLLVLPVHMVACRLAGLYRGMWIFASLPDLRRLLQAVAWSCAGIVLYALLWRPEPPVPRSLVLLYPILLCLIMGGGRIAYRMWKEHRSFGALAGMGKPVLVIGAGRAAALLLRELQRSPDWRVVGLLDDDSTKWGRELAGHRVLGGVGSLAELTSELKVRHAILALPSAHAETRRKIAGLAAQAGLQLLTVPGLEDIMSGSMTIANMRRIEIEDLLGRAAVSIDAHHVGELLCGKTVLVTGAGGSIGSELCRQICRFAPARVVLYEQSEFALYSMDEWFRLHHPDIETVPVAGDVKDAAYLDEVFARWGPQIVFHAAAYKHVPLMEVGNAWQAVRNNVLGTLLTARCADRHGVERFVMISTDKAVNPTNVMGATKRLAEMICQSIQTRSSTVFQIVRFGNVLGSAGSVIPKFQEQIARGGPVTVTHPEITRYFMSIPEAAQLVLQAASMGRGGEVFVLDMGEPVKILDLARNMIRLSGFRDEDIRIEFTGLRPGEKLYEELLADFEQTRSTPHEKLRAARCAPVPADLAEAIAQWVGNQASMADEAVRSGLKRWVPEYVPMSSSGSENTIAHGNARNLHSVPHRPR